MDQKSATEKADRRILSNNTQYSFPWINKALSLDNDRKLYVASPSGKVAGIRETASAAYGFAILLQMVAYDETVIGTPPGKGWGKQWQSALWAALLGQAG